jgi:hypothetical protein
MNKSGFVHTLPSGRLTHTQPQAWNMVQSRDWNLIQWRCLTQELEKLTRWPALIARLDLIKLSLYIWLVIHPFEIINTEPSCRYWCLNFEISIGTSELLLLGWYWIGGWKSNSEWHNQRFTAPSHTLQALQLCILDWNRKSPSVPPWISLSNYSLP